jgi:hypothetical protein
VFVVFLLGPESRLPSITCPPDDVIHRGDSLEEMLERVEGPLVAGTPFSKLRSRSAFAIIVLS